MILVIDESSPVSTEHFSLSSERRSELEEFLRRFDNDTLPIWPTSEELVRQFADVARLLLAGGGGQPDVDQLALRLEAASEPLWWWHGWDEPEVADGPPETADERRAERLVDHGHLALLSWLGHDAVEREVSTARQPLRAMSHALYMYSQDAIRYVTSALLRFIVIRPDWSQWPDPFSGAPPWYREAVEKTGSRFVAELESLAQRIAGAGARLDPNDPAAWFVLAQLALLDIDLSRDAVSIAADVVALPPGWFDLDAARLGQVATHVSQHGRTARFKRDLDALAEDAAVRYGGLPLRQPYARGGRRRAADDDKTRERRRRLKALRAVVKQFPDTTATRLRRTWENGPSAEGGLLRTKLFLQPHDPPPAASTLSADLRSIR